MVHWSDNKIDKISYHCFVWSWGVGKKRKLASYNRFIILCPFTEGTLKPVNYISWAFSPKVHIVLWHLILLPFIQIAWS
jgi:hypothetical protein